MTKEPILTFANGATLYIQRALSHLGTHLAQQPELIEFAKQQLADLRPTETELAIQKDMDKPVGLSDLVSTSETDNVIYAKRLQRDNYTRFVKNKSAVEASQVTFILRRDNNGDYELWSAWIGPLVPTFPGDDHEKPDSREFWSNHALVWGNQEVDESTITSECPW